MGDNTHIWGNPYMCVCSTTDGVPTIMPNTNLTLADITRIVREDLSKHGHVRVMVRDTDTDTVKPGVITAIGPDVLANNESILYVESYDLD